MVYDLIIIGAGVIGGAAARELSRYNLSILSLEKEEDVCCGISKGNTGIIHTPALVHENTKKAEYTVRANHRWEKISSELGFEFQRTGALILGFSEEDRITLEKYKETGEKNQKTFSDDSRPPVQYRIIEGAELFTKEPGLNPEVKLALHTPDAGRVMPYEYGTALWENAVANGVELKLECQVASLKREKNIPEETESTQNLLVTDSVWEVKTSKGAFLSRYIINAAGHGSVELGKSAGFPEHSVEKVKGQYIILDRKKSPKINNILFQAPAKGKSKLGKGILVTNTVYGNLLIGPDARWIEKDENAETDIESIREILSGAEKSCRSIESKYAIKTFAGIRPKPKGGDFIIEMKDGFINLCGIESPGLTSSPAIADEIIQMLKDEGLLLSKKPDFNPIRKPIVKSLLNLDMKEVIRRSELPDSDLKKLICRCEQVPLKRIMDGIERGIPVTTIDGVRRRTRAGQGSCQGGFCGDHIRPILSEKSGIPVEEMKSREEARAYPRITPADIRKIL
ncbi:MAG: NAD(P)/FAD-dependent oxidoreductase [Spirochaetales bacterium]|nr:NAD(P)/FAD-dependent oxidoreductase [Spirochaetales bacterium]